MARLTEADVGFANVEFEDDGETIVGTLIGISDDGTELVVGNPFYGVTWHVPAESATVTDRDYTKPGE